MHLPEAISMYRNSINITAIKIKSFLTNYHQELEIEESAVVTLLTIIIIIFLISTSSACLLVGSEIVWEKLKTSSRPDCHILICMWRNSVHLFIEDRWTILAFVYVYSSLQYLCMWCGALLMCSLFDHLFTTFLMFDIFVKHTRQNVPTYLYRIWIKKTFSLLRTPTDIVFCIH